jgi:hypothetical protein
VAIASAIFWGAVLGAWVMQVIARTSLHGMYRDALASCYAYVRDIGPLQATEPLLSDLTPPAVRGPGSFPRLLVCATANVIWDPEHPSRSLLLHPFAATKKFASFVYSHDRCGLPGVANASFATTDLERLTTRSGIFGGRERVVSLMSAVASTGAAVSPAMGRRTSDVARPIIALANFRLGRWLPNPLSATIRNVAEREDFDSRMRRKRGIGGTYDEFVPELFGLHRSDAARVYISDGGHYDNLGLLALLQARCGEVWCVDAQADAEGKAGQLSKVLRLACTELGITIDMNVAAFRGSGGLLGEGHAIGRIDYGAGRTGTLVVIKLGLTANDSQELLDYRSADRGFAHHGTFLPPWRVMWYSPTRVDMYRRVGYAHAAAASAARDAAMAPAP